MKRRLRTTGTTWNVFLFAEIMFAAFIIPALPPGSQQALYMPVYTLIYISAAYSLEKRPKYILHLVILTMVAEWVSGFFHLEALGLMAKGINILFFLVIVFLLLKQIATAREVNAEIILGSFIGYLLTGIIFSLFVGAIIHLDPGAFIFLNVSNPPQGVAAERSTSLYFVFVTLATLGYGDIVPLKPYARSFSTFIAVSGQFYIAVIVALLVGKFASRQSYRQDE